MLTPAAQCVPVLTSASHQAVPFQVAEVRAWPLQCSSTPGATASIPFSFIYYLALSHLNCEHEPSKSHQFHCPYLRSISSHHQGFCNSLVSHHKHFTASRKLGTATEQSPPIVFHFPVWIRPAAAGQMQPRPPLSEQVGFTHSMAHVSYTLFFGQPELVRFSVEKCFSSSSEKVYHIPR